MKLSENVAVDLIIKNIRDGMIDDVSASIDQ